MTTLEQILEEKKHYHVPMGLDKKEVIKSVREWLQQKPADYTVTYVDDTPPTQYLNKEKLLKELE